MRISDWSSDVCSSDLVDADDHICARHLRTLQHIEADAAETEDDDVIARSDLRGVHHGTDSSGDPATDIAAGLERCVITDFRAGDLGQDGEVREGRAPHVMKDALSLIAETAQIGRAHV